MFAVVPVLKPPARTLFLYYHTLMLPKCPEHFSRNGFRLMPFRHALNKLTATTRCRHTEVMFALFPVLKPSSTYACRYHTFDAALNGPRPLSPMDLQ
jgi:hypothetical protein